MASPLIIFIARATGAGAWDVVFVAKINSGAVMTSNGRGTHLKRCMKFLLFGGGENGLVTLRDSDHKLRSAQK
jgi:hypothetical protein